MVRALEVIERNARSQVQLIEDLLDVSRIITGRMRLDLRRVDLTPVIEAAVDAIRPAAAAKEIALQVSVDAAASPVAGDASRLQQVVWNLLSNAVKFTPDGGKVEVKAESVDSHVEITVSDSGKGIAPEFLPFVFDRFRQADSSLTRAHGGLGLGLAIVRHLVELHGGQAEVAGGDGSGATFRVRLPSLNRQSRRLEAGRGDAAEAASAPDVSKSLQGLRLLIVEDEADARDVLCVMLGRCGADVATVGSAAEALELQSRWHPDVLLSDIEMPEEDGYFLISRVRALPPELGGRVPAIALTGHARHEDRERALSAGFDAHVAKPVDIDEMAALIATLARRPKTTTEN